MSRAQLELVVTYVAVAVFLFVFWYAAAVLLSRLAGWLA